MRYARIFLICFFGLISCAHSQKKSQDPQFASQRPNYQKVFEDLVSNTADVTEAWALFDRGGFAGSGRFGQVMVLATQESAQIYFYPISGKDLKPMLIDGAKFKAAISDIRKLSKGLKDHWEQGFDMFEREFVHLSKQPDHSLKVLQRTKWRFGRAKCVEHCALAKIFENLGKQVLSASSHDSL